MENKNKFKNVPNILSIIRIFLVPLIVILLLVPSSEIYTYEVNFINEKSIELFWLIAGILFIIASLTDLLDGYIARKYKIESDLGKLLDPIADKILVNTVLILLSYFKILPVFFTIGFIARDTIVDVARMYAAKKSIIIAADRWGKLKTITQMVGISLIFLAFNISYENLEQTNDFILYFFVQNLLIILALIISFYSGYNYLKDIYKKTREK
jgi:CDP-diacylglycerol---glycerol-3-phosphate 3-phosphatidyltransferase